MSVIDVLNVVVCDGLALTFLVLSALKGLTRRYLYLNAYGASMLASSAVRQVVLHSYGFQSKQYIYAYYVSDLILTVLLYMVILSVFEIILRDSALHGKARAAFLACFAIVAAMSYFAISSSLSNHFRRYIIELQQNMYFASVVLTVLLCIALAHLRVTDPQLRIIVFGLGAYAGLQAATYAFQNMLPPAIFKAWWGTMRYLFPLATEVRLALWCAALIRVPSLSQAPTRAEEIEAQVLEPALVHAGGRS